MRFLSSHVGPFACLGLLGAGILGAGALARNAAAQDVAPPALDPVMLGQGLVLSSTMHAQAERDAARLRKQGRLPAIAPAAARTRFVPSLARRKAQAAKFMATVRRTNASLASSLAPAFKGDPIRFAAPFLSRYGMKANDVADLTAFYLTAAWYGANGKTQDPSRTDMVAVRNQLRRMFQSSPQLARASDATKQNVGEGSLYLAFVNDAFVSAMREHPEAKERLKAEIASGARSTFGLDLAKMKIGPAGLR